jgi:hypothetical protein
MLRRQHIREKFNNERQDAADCQNVMRIEIFVYFIYFITIIQFISGRKGRGSAKVPQYHFCGIFRIMACEKIKTRRLLI